MCDPVTIGYGLAALAGGTYLQQDARADRQDAMNDAAADIFNIEQDRQRGYDKERTTFARKAIDNTAGRENFDAQAGQAVDRRLASQEANAPVRAAEDGYVSPAAGATARNVQERLTTKRTEADAELDQKFTALAKLRSMGDAFQSMEIFRQPLASKMGAVNSFARQSAEAAPAEARAAAMGKSGKGRGQELLGTIAAAFGSMMLGNGAMGAGGAGTTVSPELMGAVPAEASSLFTNPNLYNFPMNSYQTAGFYA
jgi:hypothetical protein